MQCDICSDHILSDPGLFCPACARAALYPLRLRYATIIISRDSHAKKVDKIVSQARSGVEEDGSQESKTLEYTSHLSEAQEAERRIERIMQQTAILRQRVAACKQETASRKAQTTQRRSALSKNYEEYRQYHATALQPLQKSIKTLTARSSKQYALIITARHFLVRQAASLSLFRQDFLPQAEGLPVETYTIGTIPLPDLRDLNHADHVGLNAALNQAVQLVSNVCHYLGIRLPAEVRLPGEDWPRPTIYGVASSYINFAPDDLPSFPWRPKPSARSSSLSPSIKHLPRPSTRAHPRPRPLFLDRPLMKLAKEDPVLYALFIEGVALFAWDVCWLCRTQGMGVAEERWEDVCEVGRNLYGLLAKGKGREGKQKQTQTQLPLRGQSMYRSTSSNSGMSTQVDDMVKQVEGRPLAMLSPTALGVLSHNTTHHFLRSTLSIPAVPSANTITSSNTTKILPSDPTSNTSTPRPPSSAPWRFSTPTLIIDALKASLQAEQSSLEWELLDDDGTSPQDESTPASHAARTQHKMGEGEVVGATSTSTGTSGWTKLKSRAVQGASALYEGL